MAKFTNQDLRSRFQYEVDSIAAVELLIVSHDQIFSLPVDPKVENDLMIP